MNSLKFWKKNSLRKCGFLSSVPFYFLIVFPASLCIITTTSLIPNNFELYNSLDNRSVFDVRYVQQKLSNNLTIKLFSCHSLRVKYKSAQETSAIFSSQINIFIAEMTFSRAEKQCARLITSMVKPWVCANGKINELVLSGVQIECISHYFSGTVMFIISGNNFI